MSAGFYPALDVCLAVNVCRRFHGVRNYDFEYSECRTWLYCKIYCPSEGISYLHGGIINVPPAVYNRVPMELFLSPQTVTVGPN